MHVAFEIPLKLLAGISALVLGAGVFFRGPVQWRNRSFALLSLAVAIWHLGHVGYLLTGHRDLWRPIFMGGSLGAAPLGLDFALTLCGRFWRDRRRLVIPVALAGLAIWAFVVATSVWSGPTTSWLSLGFIGTTLTVALALILHQSLVLSPGPGRRALFSVFFGGVLVVIGGVSDLIPRQGRDIPDLGALATLFFLAIVCAVVLRHHLLDIDGFVLRAVGILTFSALAAVLLWVVYGWVGDGGFVPFFVAGTLVIVPLVLLAPELRRRARSLFRTNDPLIHQFSEISAALPRLTTRRQVSEVFDTASETLPPPIRLDLLEVDPALKILLNEERFLTLRFLEDALVDARGDRRERLRDAHEWMRVRSWDLVFGMSGEHGAVGALVVGGPLPERYLTETLAATGVALANQVASCLERIDAIESAERDKSMVAIGSVAAGLAHDIRNPLAALRGAGQAMGDGSTPEQRAAMLHVIQEESARLESFVRDFLDFAHPKSLRRTNVDLEQLSRDAVRARQAGDGSFTVKWNTEPGVPAVSGDAELLRRAFDNLARNALETGAEGITITVTLRRAADGTVQWSVEDDGPGIAEGGIGRMTQPHFTTKAAGTGLGLAMVKRVVEQHGGRLAIANRSGGGARFTMTLPVGPA